MGSEKKDRIKKIRLLPILKWLWLVLVVVGSAFYFFKHKQQILLFISEISYWRIATSLVLLLAGKLFIIRLVQFSIQAEGWNYPFYRTLGMYGITSMGKYIPGGVWHFVGRISIYRLKGFNPKQITRSMMLENVWLLSSALVVGMIGVAIYRFDQIASFLRLPISLTFRILLIVLIVILWVIALGVLKKWIDTYTVVPTQPILVIMIVGLFLWAIIGLSFYVMFPDTSIDQAFLFVGGYALSWSIGYLAILAPGGVGVREAVLAWMFISIAGGEMIAVYAAMNRIIWLVAEMLYGLVGVLQKQEFMPGVENDKESTSSEVVELKAEESENHLVHKSLSDDEL